MVFSLHAIFHWKVTLLCATVCCVRHTGGAETDDQAEATATKAIICKPGDVLFNIAKKNVAPYRHPTLAPNAA